MFQSRHQRTSGPHTSHNQPKPANCGCFATTAAQPDHTRPAVGLSSSIIKPAGRTLQPTLLSYSLAHSTGVSRQHRWGNRMSSNSPGHNTNRKQSAHNSPHRHKLCAQTQVVSHNTTACCQPQDCASALLAAGTSRALSTCPAGSTRVAVCPHNTHTSCTPFPHTKSHTHCTTDNHTESGRHRHEQLHLYF